MEPHTNVIYYIKDVVSQGAFCSLKGKGEKQSTEAELVIEHIRY